MVERRFVVLGGALAGLVGLAACGSKTDADLDPRLQKIRPSATPSPVFAPATQDPIESRVVKGEGFTIAIPARFTEKTVKTANGSTGYSFTLISDQPAPLPTTIAVIADVKPAAGAIEQSFTLEQTLRLDPKAVVKRSEITWPNTQRAILIQWTQSPGGTTDVVETWQLMAEVTPALILNAVATAPQPVFAREKLGEILKTFTIVP